MKRIFALFLAVVMLLSLTACGGEPDPNAGKYLGVRGEMNGVILTMEELYPGESYLELKDGGKGKLVLEGDAFNITWKLDGENFTMDIEGDACDGTLKDGVVIFDFMNMGMLLTFALEGVDVPEPTVPQSDTLEMGFYPLYAVDQDGEYTDNETIKMLGMDQTNYLICYGDGTVEVVMENDQYFCTYNETAIIDDEGGEIQYAIVDGLVEMYLEGNMTFYYEQGDIADIPEPPVAAAEVLEPGFYQLYALDDNGDYVDNDTVIAAEMQYSTYIVVNEDGTADINMEGEVATCTYNEEYFVTEDGYEIAYAVVDGLIELYMEGNMVFYYEPGDMSNIPVEEPGAAGAFPVDIIEDFYGDWHGWCVVVDGTGDYEDEIGNEFEMLARYAFDADGNCTPWMSIYSDPEDNFQDISLYYDESDQFVYLSGQLFGMEILSYSDIYESFGSLCLTMYLQSEYGNLNIVACLRHPDAEWDAYDYPCMPEAALEFYAGKSFEERVEIYELDPADLPALS